MRYLLVSLAVADAIMAALLLQHAWENSWFSWSPPGSDVWYTEFRPYVTFYPGILLAVLGAVTAVSLAAETRRGPEARPVWTEASALSHLALGVGMLVASIVGLSFFIICSDPGGCRDVMIPYLPVVLPSIILVVMGGIASLLGRASRRPEASALPLSPREP